MASNQFVKGKLMKRIRKIKLPFTTLKPEGDEIVLFYRASDIKLVEEAITYVRKYVGDALHPVYAKTIEVGYYFEIEHSFENKVGDPYQGTFFLLAPKVAMAFRIRFPCTEMIK